MTIPTNPMETFSPFLPTTYNVPEADDRLDVFLVDNLANISDVINDKKIGAYTQDVTSQNGNKFAYDTTGKVRNGSQFLARIKSYPANGIITIKPPPDINPQFMLFQAFGSASKPPSKLGAGDGDFFSFYGEGNSNITFTFSDTAIVVTTNGLGSGYSGFIVIDFIPDGQ